ncbi:SufB/SufD family protein [Sphingomonas montana]|uniref:SufB/SufD family protein n=1 Tax=Sphingomonas montana TaxID=1843236 RepID=UPI00096C2235|nr:SufD family Fe-S cluster assembly protein [Sphingomonas montana]
MTLALPTTREEAWRWSDLTALPALANQTPTGTPASVDPLWIAAEGPRLLFVDGRYVAEHSTPGRVTLGPVETTGTHPLGMLTADHDGWTLTVPTGAEQADTIQIVHIATRGANHVPARIMLADGARASIVETHAGDGWSNRQTDIALGADAHLTRNVRLMQASGFTSTRETVTLAANAHLAATVLAIGDAGTRIDAGIMLHGDAARAEYGGALLSRDRQRHDAAIAVRHDALDGVSRQIWRAVADDRATASLAARVEVARGAQKTDGEQSLRGLLLRRTATINLKPELEIFADDVKCAHGATVGELDAQALWYLASRGVPPQAARALLTRAFVGNVFDRIEEEPIREAFRAAADAWLGAEA